MKTDKKSAWMPRPAELARVALRALSPSRRIAFVHIPKCGGTSIRSAVKRHFPMTTGDIPARSTFNAAIAALGEDAPRMALLDHAARLRRDMLAHHLDSGACCVVGHAPLARGTLDMYPEVSFVTVLRDPVARFISHHRFSHKSDRHGRIDEPLDAFLETERARFMGRLYAKYLSGLEIGAHDASDAEARSIAALERFAVVGFLDDLPAFERDMTKLIGRRVTIPHENKGPGAGAPAALTPEQKAKIEALCAPDLAIYHAARAMRDAAAERV